MPNKVDKDANVAIDYQAEFFKLADKSNVHEKNPFCQASYTGSMKDNGAYCYGFSLAYIIELYKEKGSAGYIQGSTGENTGRFGNPLIQELIEDARSERKRMEANKDVNSSPSSESTLFELIKRYMNSQYTLSEMYTALENGRSIKALAENYNLFAVKTGLQFVDRREKEDMFHHMKKVADYLADFSPSFFIVASSNHAMAAANVRGGIYFFDPNFGEVVFKKPLDFKNFFKTWFNRDEIKDSYKGMAGSMHQTSKPNKNLFLKVDRYIGSRGRQGMAASTRRERPKVYA